MIVALFGASGKIGRRTIPLLRERGAEIRALIHRTPLPDDLADGVDTRKGSITDPGVVESIVEGADIVLQMATTKEDPETFFDVSIRGTWEILDACRRHQPRQFLLLGGDAARAIWFSPHPDPIRESDPAIAYPGHYAFSKVIEETMTEQYHYQYKLPTTILRSSWVFEEEDLLQHFSLLANVDPSEPGHGFGEVSEEVLALVREGKERIPILLDGEGKPLTRHIVHIDDVIQALDRMLDNPKALGEDFNIAAPAPFDYRTAAEDLSAKLNVPTIELPCPDYHGFSIDISKARSVLGYAPENDFSRMADRAIAARTQTPE